MRELNISEIDGVVGGDATQSAGCTTDSGAKVSSGFVLVTPLGDKGYTTQKCDNGNWTNFTVVLFSA